MGLRRQPLDRFAIGTVLCAVLVAGPLIGLPLSFIVAPGALSRFSGLLPEAIQATAFILVPKTPKSPARARAAFEFFRWVLENGQQSASDLEYVPLPPDLVKQIEAYWKSAFTALD